MSNPTKDTKKFRNLVDRINRTNDKFEEADADKKRLMVAKDVLRLLDAKAVAAIHNIYVELDQVPDKFTGRGGFQVSDLFKSIKTPTCNVCAIGGAMVAATMRLNDVSTWCNSVLEDSFDEHEEGGMSARAVEVFGKDLLRRMETAFERGSFGYHRLKSANGRLRAIYQNLVDNRGARFTNYRGVSELWPEVCNRYEYDV